MNTRSALQTLVAASFIVLSAVSAFPQAAPEARSALLIANGDYKNFGKLPNPLPEARALRAALEHLGFTVTLVENADREKMLDAIAEFEATLRERKGIAFFHYGGHAVQVAGKNYLIPAAADIPDERRVSTRAVDLEEVMGSLIAAGSDTNIVVLDACRNNPLPATSGRSATRGLDVLGTKPKNSVVVYAAEANTEALDGIFTPALVKHLATPGLSLSEVLQRVRREVYDRSGGKQTPGEYNQLFAPVYLAGDAGNSGAVTSSPVPGTSAGRSGLSESAPYVPSPSVSSAELVVSADQEGAEIYLDGKLLGVAPNLFIGLPVGRELLVEAKKGAWSAAERITLHANETREVFFSLELGKGNLFFQVANPASYRLLLNGREWGTLSAAGLAKELGAGNFDAELRGVGMHWKGRVEVKVGATTTVKASPWEVGTILVELPADAEFRLVNVTSSGSSPVPVSRSGRGRERLELLPASRYTLEAAGIGYETYREIIDLVRAEEKRIEPWTTGTLIIETDPPGAAVSLDGHLQGTSPITVKGLRPGYVDVSVHREGYENGVQQKLVEVGKCTAVNLVLSKLGALVVTTVPSGALIFVNGVERGRSPLTLKDLAAGSVTLAAKTEGYEDSSQSTLIEAGKTTQAAIVLAKRALKIGDAYAGGFVFKLDGHGRGLVAAPSDQSTNANWSTAKKLCDDLVLNGFSDWYLPNKDELNLMYVNLMKQGRGGFPEYACYWSSTEFGSSHAWGQVPKDGYQSTYHKNGTTNVRAVRAFTY